MKYLRKYNENKIIGGVEIANNDKYKVDEYVLVNIESLKRKSAEQRELYGQELDDDRDGTPRNDFYKSYYQYAKVFLLFDRSYAPYRLIFYDGTIHDVDEEDIIRLLTEDEIQIYEALKTGTTFGI